MTPDPATQEPNGDPVCWLHRLCAVCGAVPTAESPGRCWRCGANLPDDTRHDPLGPDEDGGRDG